MAPSDLERYNKISGEPLPEIPQPEYSIVFDRKKPILKIGVTPLAFNNDEYKILASFMLKIESTPVSKAKSAAAKAESNGGIYAAHSILAEGKWAKISVSENGVYQLTDEVIRKAGFSDLSKVKIYGYGGNLQPEKISQSYLKETDDLKEVEQCIVEGKHLFYAKGPVSYNSKTTATRTRNPYSNYGYYFITQNDDEVKTVEQSEFIASFTHTNDDYHSLYEVDNYAWYSGGRNLVESTTIANGSSKTYTIKNDTGSKDGKLYINLTAAGASKIQVALNDSVLGRINLTQGDYDKCADGNKTFTVSNLKEENAIKVTVETGGPARLDYICFTYSKPREDYTLEGKTFPTAKYIYNITNQDRHSDDFADMVIIIPTSQKLLGQAERLKSFHESNDGMRVTIVPADELYNEFSSGTPDANAYRRYLKMLYDRAGKDEANFPKYLLLFGDCVWDNRMLTSTTANLNPDDYLLCFESENSNNEVACYVDDGFYCLLDEGEGANPQSADLLDCCVGRFPVTTVTDAKVMVDKTIKYVTNENAGAWQNVLMFMGDDGNQNLHMEDANEAAEETKVTHPGYVIKKVMWDAYERVSSASGNTYPEVTNIIKAQQQAGALIMDYAGHGSAIQVSHEKALRITDFAEFTNTNLPLWITASCDIMPFDGTEATIGETAVLNSKGGAIAFFGTTRTVYANYNKRINMAFVRYVLGQTDGKPTTLGEAQRLAKNYMITSGQDKTTNKLQYSLLGDPAIALNQPKLQIVIDSINGKKIPSNDVPLLKAGSIAKIAGHVVTNDAFNGSVTAIVRDSEEKIVCKLNDKSESGAEEAFEYTDRTKTLYSGSDNVKDGKFNITFAVSKDLNYSNASGLINVFAVSEDKKMTANGYTEAFNVGGTESLGTDSIGPSIYCYLNSPSFVNGGNVNSSPYFVAEINDEDGINATGNGIGHDLMLIVDGEMSKTYNLNDNFSYDFGSYTSGTTYYSIPTLDPGAHTLQFRAWDIFNNPSTTYLKFNVVSALEPKLTSISCTNNPASEQTTFIINHDRMGSTIDVTLDVMDMSGRLLWQHNESGVSTSGSYTIDWDLTVDNGQRLQTGVYLYRARISCEGSDYDSKAKKLIIIR